MSETITLPELGESVTEGTITRWLKEVGDEIAVDEPLVEVSTDKVDTEIPSPVAGTIVEIKVREDEGVEVGQILARVGSPDTTPAEASSAEEPSPETVAVEHQESEPHVSSNQNSDRGFTTESETSSKSSSGRASTGEETPSTSQGSSRTNGYVTPVVRRLAREQGVDLAEVAGTGVGGRIRKQDVLAAAAAPHVETGEGRATFTSSATSVSSTTAPPAPNAPETSLAGSKRGTTQKASRIRQTIAERMIQSLDTSAQLTQVHEIDMTRIVQLRNQVKERFKVESGVNLTYLAFITQAATEALRAHPVLNSQYDAQTKQITYHDSKDIGIAVDTERGLLVPVIKGAGNLNLTGIASAISDLAARTRDNQVKPDELSGGTFSITNLGSFGALFDTPVINQPQVAILGPGNIVKRPVVSTDAEGNDVIAIRHMMYLSLTYDHRIVDGADAGRFMLHLKNRLEDGEFGAELGL